MPSRHDRKTRELRKLDYHFNHPHTETCELCKFFVPLKVCPACREVVSHRSWSTAFKNYVCGKCKNNNNMSMAHHTFKV